MLPAAILAGGLASRLDSLTRRIPKSLLGIAGRPFILHQLDMLRREGVERVVLCVGHLGRQIEALVGDGRTAGLSVQYSSDGRALLGTGGALRQALPLLAEEFFVLYGDSYSPCSLARMQAAYRAARRPALMAVVRNDNRWDTSNVSFRDGVLRAYDKRHPRPDMTYIDFGLSILSSSLLATYPAGTPFDLADVFHELSMSGQLAAFEVTERFYEIGSLLGIAEAEEFLSRRSPGS